MMDPVRPYASNRRVAHGGDVHPRVSSERRRFQDETGKPDFSAIQGSEEFRRLRRGKRSFIFPMSLAFLAWYLTFALMSVYAHEFMSRKLLGAVNTGTVLGLLQFVSTMTIVHVYSRFARKTIDPQVDRLHELAGADGK